MKKIRKRIAGFLALVLACSALAPGSPVLAEEPEQPETCQITVAEPEHGTILLNGEVVSALEAIPGDRIEVTGEPEEGYQMAGVAVVRTDGEQVAVEQSENGYSFPMPEQDVTVSASFEPALKPEEPVPTVGTEEDVPRQELERADGTEETAQAESEAETQKGTDGTAGQPAAETGNPQEETVSLYRYLSFYDTASGDVNATVGFHIKDLTGVIREGYIEAVVNDHPEWLDLEETDGYPRVILNYAMN